MLPHYFEKLRQDYVIADVTSVFVNMVFFFSDNDKILIFLNGSIEEIQNDGVNE